MKCEGGGVPWGAAQPALGLAAAAVSPNSTSILRSCSAAACSFAHLDLAATWQHGVVRRRGHGLVRRPLSSSRSPPTPRPDAEEAGEGGGVEGGGREGGGRGWFGDFQTNTARKTINTTRF